jgi:hypothetical protein
VHLDNGDQEAGGRIKALRCQVREPDLLVCVETGSRQR